MDHIKINRIKVLALIVQEDSCVNMMQQQNQSWTYQKIVHQDTIVLLKPLLLFDVLLEHFLLREVFNQLLNVKNVLLESTVMECLLQMLQQGNAMLGITVNKELKLQILQMVKQEMFALLLTIVLSEPIILYLVLKEPSVFQLSPVLLTTLSVNLVQPNIIVLILVELN